MLITRDIWKSDNFFLTNGDKFKFLWLSQICRVCQKKVSLSQMSHHKSLQLDAFDIRGNFLYTAISRTERYSSLFNALYELAENENNATALWYDTKLIRVETLSILVILYSLLRPLICWIKNFKNLDFHRNRYPGNTRFKRRT